MRELETGVRLVSLGSWCGVKTALRNLDLDGPSLPFDWMRSSIESVNDSLETEFQNFLAWERVQESPYKEHATPYGRIYLAHRHSFWHDNLEELEDREKIRRRIERFLHLGRSADDGERLLFIRSLNTTRELREASVLMSLLAQRFGAQRTWLLLLVDAQRCEQRFVFRDAPQLIVQTVDVAAGVTGQRYTGKYHAPILAALELVRGVTEGHCAELQAPCDLCDGGRDLLRHVCLGEDLTVPWSHDPLMPPSAALRDPDSVVKEQVREHLAFSGLSSSQPSHPLW